MQKIFLFLLLICALPLRAENKPEPIKIGALMPLSGEFAMPAAAFREGMTLAIDAVNGANGINGQHIELIVEDTQSNPRLVNVAATKLINIDHVIAALTTSYPETEVGGLQFQRAGLPSLALWDSSPQIDELGDYIFAIGPWTPSDAEVGAKYCAEKLKAKKMVIVNTVEHWSELVSDLFEKEFTKYGGEIVGRFRQNPGDVEFRSTLARIKALAPDAIYAPLAADLVPFHKQRKTMEINVPIISSGIISDEHIAIAPEIFEGVYQTQISDPDRPQTQALAKQFKAKFGREMTMTWYVATGYDAIQLYALALRAVGPRPEKIKEFLYTVKNYLGAAQDITITPGGSSPYYVRMFQIKDGKFQLS